jgi:CheY-like chemotaxis protein
MAVQQRADRLILVVEDDALAREGLNLLLQAEGYQVAVAANGKEALDWLRKGSRPDLVLLDMLMPVLDGWHFLKSLQQNRLLAGTPIIITTSTPLSLEWAHDHACAGFLKKPINLDELLAEIRRCLAEA